MKYPHLIRTEEAPEALSALWAALASLGLRFGWLDLDGEALPDEPLSRAARAGALRAVQIGSDGSTVRKTRRGPVILADLLRANFVGCAVVLVRGGGLADSATFGWTDAGWLAAPRLRRIDLERLRLDGEQGVLELNPLELAQRLRRPSGR